MRAEARIGAVINEKWTLERLLGVGGMASVYAARHRNGARMAIKILHPDLAKSDEVNQRFLREGYAANKVEHPGVVKVLDDDVVHGGVDDGTAYLVMELLEGESLESWMHRVGLPMEEDEVLAIIESVLDVLVHAHARGVIHRDLKPENLFLERVSTERGPLKFGWDRVKVLDFGLARVADSAMVTRAGVAVGTPSVMSPEQASGRTEDLDGRSDLFSVGAVMFRMLTGRRVHEADSPIAMVVAMATCPAPRIQTVRPSIDESIAAIIDRALQFRREERYSHAELMRADVVAARAGLPLPSWIGDASTIAGGEPSVPAMVGGKAARSGAPESTESAKPSRPAAGNELSEATTLPRHKPGPARGGGATARARGRGPSSGFVVSVLWIVGVLALGFLVISGVRAREPIGSVFGGWQEATSSEGSAAALGSVDMAAGSAPVAGSASAAPSAGNVDEDTDDDDPEGAGASSAPEGPSSQEPPSIVSAASGSVAPPPDTDPSAGRAGPSPVGSSVARATAPATTHAPVSHPPATGRQPTYRAPSKPHSKSKHRK